MENNELLQNVFSDIMADFYSTFDIEPYPVRILIVGDLCKGYSDLRPDHLAKRQVRINTARESNGIAVPPRDFEGIFTILLDASYVKESLDNNNANWIGTVAHEAAHINDFIQFAKISGATDYDIILNTDKYRMFHLWTEFNAKAKGYYFIRKYTFDNITDEAQLPYILETEFPFQANNFFNIYNSTTNGDIQMNYTVHFIGRLYILQKLFPRYFTDDYIKQMLGANPWMYELYVFLSNHNKLEDAYKDFDEMKEILRKNFKGI